MTITQGKTDVHYETLDLGKSKITVLEGIITPFVVDGRTIELVLSDQGDRYVIDLVGPADLKRMFAYIGRIEERHPRAALRRYDELLRKLPELLASGWK